MSLILHNKQKKTEMKKQLVNRIFGILAVFVLFVVVLPSCSQDVCQTMSCVNGGTCSGGVCKCPTGWTGNLCQTSAFGGNWTGSEICDSAHYSFAIEIDPYATDANKFIIRNPHGYSAQVTAKKATDSSIVIDAQVCDSVIFAGSLKLQAQNNLVFSYTCTDTANGHVKSCTGTYSRQ
jgi:hypothetical protein